MPSSHFDWFVLIRLAHHQEYALLAARCNISPHPLFLSLPSCFELILEIGHEAERNGNGEYEAREKDSIRKMERKACRGRKVEKKKEKENDLFEKVKRKRKIEKKEKGGANVSAQLRCQHRLCA